MTSGAPLNGQLSGLHDADATILVYRLLERIVQPLYPSGPDSYPEAPNPMMVERPDLTRAELVLAMPVSGDSWGVSSDLIGGADYYVVLDAPGYVSTPASWIVSLGYGHLVPERFPGLDFTLTSIDS